MSSVLLLIIAGLCISVSQIINKRLSSKNVGSSSLTTTTMLTNAVVSTPLLFVNFYISRSPYVWALIIASVLAFALSTYFLFRAYKLIDISIVSIVQRLNVVFVVIMGIVILGEMYTAASYAGLFLILMGGVVVVYKKQRFDLNMGIAFAVLVALFGAIASVSDKVILNDFSPFTYVFVNNLLVGLVFIPKKGVVHNSLRLFKNNKAMILTYSVLATIAFLLVMIVLKSGDVSRIMPVYKSVALIATVFMGIVVLKENGQLYQKIFGTILSIAGIVLLYI